MKIFRRIMKLKPAEVFLKFIFPIEKYGNIQSLHLNISKHLFSTLHHLRNREIEKNKKPIGKYVNSI